jgi:sucrose-phosphate synthase
MDRPMILSLSRPDERKNVGTLLEAYAEHPTLRDQANLVLIAGTRDDVQTMDRAQRRVLTELFLQIDYYDLYGCVAFPKDHKAEDVPDLYRLAAASGGVFVLPAYMELFGLTLIEAAASGLPVVATENGGPKDIVGYCENGLLVNPNDTEELGRAIESALADRERWQRWSEQGIARSHHRYAWASHVASYLETIDEVLHTSDGAPVDKFVKSKMPKIDRLLISDIDNTLLGDREALGELLEHLRRAERYAGFGIATGRTLESALEVLQEWGVPMPDVLITSVGSEIYYGHEVPKQDRSWKKHLGYRWERAELEEALSRLPGLKLQPDLAQRPHKLSYYVDEEKAPSMQEIRGYLRQHDLSANVIYSHGEFLDVLPLRASKGRALRYLAMRWDIPVDRILVAGDSGNDEEMLVGNTLGVVVGNYSPELADLRGNPHVFFAEGHFARGILEGLEAYAFLGEIYRPENESVVA